MRNCGSGEGAYNVSSMLLTHARQDYEQCSDNSTR